MAQRESSRIRNNDTRANVPAGIRTSLINQKNLLLTRIINGLDYYELS